MSFSLINQKIIWEKVCKFDKLAANNLAREFVGNGGLAGASEEISSDEWGRIGNGGKRRIPRPILLDWEHIEGARDGRPEIEFE